MPDRLIRRYDHELVDAVRFDGDNVEAVPRLARVPLGTEPDPPRLRIGGIEVRPGDWVMRDDDGRIDLARPTELYSLYRSQLIE